MSIELLKNDYITDLWFADSPEGDNFLAILMRRDGQYIIQYRFRYKKDDKTFDSADERNFYKATCVISTPLEKIRSSMNQILELIAQKYFVGRRHLIINGGPDKFAAIIKKYPSFIHCKEEKLGTNL